MTPDRYAARLCWNTRNWVQPSGDAPKVEQRDTYAAQNGFGHEEWLFNFQWILDGWKYGFLQPINKSIDKLKGAVIDVRLFTIAGRKGRFYVGELNSCTVLREPQAAAALAQFKKRGWLAQMRQQVRSIGGDIKALEWDSPLDIINVRFKPSDALLYDPPVPVGRGDYLREIQRYVLVSLSGRRAKIDRQWQTRVASTKKMPTGKRARSATDETTVDPVHNNLQNELAEILRKKYGKRAVRVEENFVDIRLNVGKRIVFLEIKSDPRPRFALRQGLGQLLEYDFIASSNGPAPTELIVAATGELDQQEQSYLKHLQGQWNIPLRYVCFRSGMNDVDV